MSASDSKRYYWVKLKKDFFQQHKIKALKALPNGRLYALIYLELMAESVSHEGRLRFDDFIPYDNVTLGAVIDEDPDSVRVALDWLQKFGLVDIMDDQTLYLNQVAMLTGSETGSAIRQRELRQSGATAEERRLNATNGRQVGDNVAKSIEYRVKSIEINTNNTNTKKIDNNKLSNKEKNKTINTSNISSYIEKYTTDENVRNALASFVEMRKSIKKPLTAKAMELALKQLTKLAGDNPQLQQDIIEQSVLHSWQTFYAIVGDKGRTLYTAQEQARMRSDEVTEMLLALAREQDRLEMESKNEGN